MTLTELEVEQYKADGPGTPTPEKWNALCDLALAQIRAQENGTGSEAATLVRAPIDQSVTPAPAAPLKLIGEVTKYGVVWADQNPHAHPLGTKFYAAGKETNCASETRPEVTRPETLAPAAPTHDALDGLAAKAKEYARRGDDCGALAREIISALRQSGAGRDVERYRIICENAWADQVEHNSWYLAVDIPLNHGGTLTKEHIDSAVDALKERT